MPGKKRRKTTLSAKVEILNLSEAYRFGNLFAVNRAELRHEKFSGEMSEPLTRINFERGPSVGVLLYHPAGDSVVLIRQFRYPVFASLLAEKGKPIDAKKAWTLEIVAGIKEKDLTNEAVAQNEILEETGYRLKGSLERIGEVYPSPGASSEKITLYLANVDTAERVASGGGVAAEGEDIRIEEIPFAEALQMIATGEIVDAKTVVALQALALARLTGGNSSDAGS